MRVLLLAISFLAASASQARTTCTDTTNGRLCQAELDFATFAEAAFDTQYQSQWCWAASISMVFAHYGHPVSQARIVSDVYGSPVNMPAQAGIVIAQQLNRAWVDDNGATFTATLTGAYDFDAGVAALTNQQIVGELAAERPLVLGNKTHAVVLTAVQYFETPQGPNIVSGGVFDPWPGVGARSLSSAELIRVDFGGDLRFLATTRVVEGGPGTGFEPEEPGDLFGCQTVAPSSWMGPLLGALLFALLFARRRRVGRSRAAASVPTALGFASGDGTDGPPHAPP
jgi:hypothetical protein